MSYSTIPVATIPVAFSPAVPAPEPVTPEEAAAIARRIRVEARLPRVALVGTILGLVCGLAAIWPFLDSNGYMADQLVRGQFGALAFLPGWLLAGLLPLLAFYAGRLHFQTGRSSTGEIEASLRKIRLVILGSMFASTTAFVFLIAENRRSDLDTIPWLSLLYLGSLGGCIAIIGDVRRGLGDFDSEHQRRRRRLARGFTVELNPAAIPTATVVAEAPPTLASIHEAIPFASAAPTRLPAPLPPPLPVAMPASTIAPELSSAGEDEHFKDLRLLMTLAVMSAVFLYAVRLGEGLFGIFRGLAYLAMMLQAIFAPARLVGARSSGIGGFGQLWTMASVIATILLGICSVLWLVWGLLALNYGPGFRKVLGWLTLVTLVLAVVAVIPAWIYGPLLDQYSSNFPSTRGAYFPRDRLSRAPEIIHGLFIGLLLTRPGIKRLFARSSETDDER